MIQELSAIVPQESLTFWICNVTWWQTRRSTFVDICIIDVFVANRISNWTFVFVAKFRPEVHCHAPESRVLLVPWLPCFSRNHSVFGCSQPHQESHSCLMFNIYISYIYILIYYVCLLFHVFWNSNVLNLPSTFRDWNQCWSQVGTHADLLGSRRSAILQAVDSRVQNLFLGAPVPFESKNISSKTENKQRN